MVLDLDLFRADKGGDPERIRENARKRFDDVQAVENVINLDNEWRKLRHSMDLLNKAKNQVSKAYGEKMKQVRAAEAAAKKASGDQKPSVPGAQAVETSKPSTAQATSTAEPADADVAALTELFVKHIGSVLTADQTLDELKQHREQVEQKTLLVQQELDRVECKRDSILREIGNLLSKDAHISNDEDENVILRTFGNCELGKRPEEGKFYSHVDLILAIDGMDGERGASISGNRGYFLKGPAWFLKEALINYAVRLLADAEYEVIEPPYWMCKSVMSEVAQLAQFDEELYRVQSSKANADSEEKYLIATAEQPIAAFHRNEWLAAASLPLRYCGISTCFRQEVGAHGRDTRGIFRVHQFDKVEQFVLCSPNDSWTHFESMVATSEKFYQSLDIPYRIVSIVSGALNNAAALKHDLEAWFPGSGQFRELVSVSNCTDYQARRLGVKFGLTKKMNAKAEYVHMLNGTMCATSRTVCALLELNQTPEGIRVPEALRPFMPTKYQELIPYKIPLATVVMAAEKEKN